jgi:CRP-like cAMP-binding protein
MCLEYLNKKAMKTFVEIIQNIYPLSDESIALLLPHVRKTFYPKNTYVIKPEDFKKEYFFIKEGLLRVNINILDKEIILAFLSEKEYFPSSCVSFISEIHVFQTISISTVKDCVIYELNKKILDILFWENIEIAYFMFNLINICYVDSISGIIRNKCFTPTERYKLVIQMFPEVFNNLSINETASFLGINNTSLSRIRKKIIEEERAKRKQK